MSSTHAQTAYQRKIRYIFYKTIVPIFILSSGVDTGGILIEVHSMEHMGVEGIKLMLCEHLCL